jgi:release factor glutamine methyltransferase
VDVSEDALDVAKENAFIHKVSDRLHFVNEDMFTYLSVETTSRSSLQFDLIISNPPYIPDDQLPTLPADVQHEPSLALKGGKDGLDFYRHIIKYTPCLLRGGGYLMMEFGDGQEKAIQELISSQSGFFSVQIHQDLAGRVRFVSAQKIS